MGKTTKAEKADIAVAKAATPLRETWSVRALGAASEIADQPPLIALCAGVLGVGLLRRDARIARAGARMLAAELLATKLKSLVKHRVDRTRPRVLAAGKRYRMTKGESHASAVNSFPSGHTAGAVAVTRALAREFPETQTAGATIAGAVALIQIPRCQHYPTDLAAGALIGLVAEAAISAVFPLPQAGEGDSPAGERGEGVSLMLVAPPARHTLT